MDAPSPDPNKRPVYAPGPDPDPQAKIAPGPDADPSTKEAPGQVDPEETIEAMPGDRPLTDTEKAGVLKSIKAGKPLTKDQKDLLRGEARWMWKNNSGGKGPQPGAKHQIHHLIPLQFAHLFPELYPNAPLNLYLMPTQAHIDLHIMLNKEYAKGKITKKDLDEQRSIIIKSFPGKFMWDKVK